MQELTQARLKEVLRYDPEIGQFTWLIVRKRGLLGKVAGGLVPDSKGRPAYITINIASQAYKAHRLAWLYMTGSWPAALIDHKDMNGLNNKWGNLREATLSQNKANGKRYSSNSCGFKGVSRREAGRWRARISIDNKRIHLGNFADPAEAYAAYVAAAPKFHGEFARIA